MDVLKEAGVRVEEAQDRVRGKRMIRCGDPSIQQSKEEAKIIFIEI